MEGTDTLTPGTPAAVAVTEMAKLLVKRLRSRPEAERSRPLRVWIDEKTAPYVYAVTAEQGRRAWAGIEALETRGLVRLSYDAKRPASEPPMYRHPRLEVLPGSLEGLATLAAIRLDAPFGEQLAQALAGYPAFGLPAAQAALLGCPTELAQFGLEDAVQRLMRLQELARTHPDLYLREASAMLFDGLSKVLDGRTDFVTAITGHLCPWRETPVPLIVAAPAQTLTEVVFVENLTTFERLRRRSVEHPSVAFIYSAGWRGGASRARSDFGRSLFFDRPFQATDYENFCRALDGASPVPELFFFGDLDLSGMGILKTMRQTFPALTAWRPGYGKLLAVLQGGGGHLPALADKERQQDPGLTGCHYADTELLSALRSRGRFVDQEIIS